MESQLNLTNDYKASRIISSCPIFGRIHNNPNYGKVYYQTNEDLHYPYSDIDFYEKDVLSVLSSGDHVFTARFLEAAKVDAFDINKLTLYYFYLRLWSIKYRRELFPDILGEDKSWLESLLKEVKPKSEREKIVLSFFQRHFKDRTNLKNFFFEQDTQLPGRTTYRDVSELMNHTETNFNFYNIDLFKNQFIENQYDIILLSNILEWSHEEEKTKQALENLANLTRKDGIVVCARLIKSTDLAKEADIFKPYFEQENFGKAYVYHRK